MEKIIIIIVTNPGTVDTCVVLLIVDVWFKDGSGGVSPPKFWKNSLDIVLILYL